MSITIGLLLWMAAIVIEAAPTRTPLLAAACGKVEVVYFVERDSSEYDKGHYHM
jgi:hypothetical protein